MTTVQIQIPNKLIPIFSGDADVRGAYGGRGSAKTRSFAIMSAVRGYKWGKAGREGIILCARQFMNTLDDSSLEEVKMAIREVDWLNDYYEIGEKYIKSKDGNIHYKFAGLDRNISSIKSKSRILLCWVDEADPVVDKAWTVLIPTLREEDSELWVTWNPERKNSPVDKRFRRSKDPLTKVVEMNWRDNPKFPDILGRAKQRDLNERPEQCDHIWEGGYATVLAGAYFAKHLLDAKKDKRIGRVGPDPLMKYRLFMDIGGTGNKSDAFSIWAAQFIGKEARVLNYYEARGQAISVHLAWMRENKYEPDNSSIWLPHDGSTNDKVYDVSYESAFKSAGYTVEVVPNQGTGAAKMRIESARRTFPSVWFNKESTQAGIDALGWYHEKQDENRDIGLGPEHDWASHGADAYGLMSIVFEEFLNQSTEVGDYYAAFRRHG